MYGGRHKASIQGLVSFYEHFWMRWEMCVDAIAADDKKKTRQLRNGEDEKA